MNMSASQLRAFILNVTGSLRTALFTGQQASPNARVDNLYPDGGADDVRVASPFGISSGVPKGVAAFYQGVFGSRIESVVLGMLHFKRPAAAPGETILYATTADGLQITARVALKPDGSIEITAPQGLTVKSSKVTLSGQTTIALGDGGEKTINGETFITDFLKHQHTSGGPGNPTTAPINVQGQSAYLSAAVTAKK